MVFGLIEKLVIEKKLLRNYKSTSSIDIYIKFNEICNKGKKLTGVCYKSSISV